MSSNFLRCKLSCCSHDLVTLCLDSFAVDTNKNCTHLVIDNWLELRLESPKVAEKLLVVITQLRSLLKNLLNKKLSQPLAAKEEKNIPDNFFSTENQPTEELKMEKDERKEDPILLESLPNFMKLIMKQNQKEFLCSASELSLKLAEFIECAVNHQFSQVKKSALMTIFRMEDKPFEEIISELDPMQLLEGESQLER